MENMELYEFCKGNLLDEKLFIVPSRSIGLQMINKITRDGYPTINLRPITLKRLAFEILEDYIENNNILIIDEILGSNLIMDTLKEINNEDKDFFFKEDLIDAKTAEEIYKVIMELKYAKLENFPKEKNIDKIYEGYERNLKELNAMDFCDIVRKSCESESLQEYKSKKIGIAENIEFHNVEKDLFEKLIENNCTRIKMPVKRVDGQPKNYYFKDHNIWDLKGKDIVFFEEYGALNEINYIIKDIKNKRIAIDQVVIAYTNGKYADLINIEFEKNQIPITFGQGLGIESSSAYRFIDTIFSWAKNYYNLDEIRPIFINNDIKIQAKYGEIDGSISPSSMYEELVVSRILYGKENYNRILGINKLQNNLDINLGTYSTYRRDWLKEFFGDLFYAIPDKGQVSFSDYIPRLINLIRKYTRNLNKYDGAAKEVVIETLNRIQSIKMEVNREEYFDTILSYIKQNKILRAQAQPGAVFATSFKNAGYTGRGYLYLIGLDSNTLSNKVVESPILLDVSRNRISNSLSYAHESYRYKKYKIKELLTADFKNISIGYSNFDTVDVKIQSPSQIYNELKDRYGDNHREDIESLWTIYGKDLAKSGTSLETLAECSRKAYLRYKMGLMPKEEVDIKIDRWLDPLTKGNIVHFVLNQYFDLDKGEQKDGILEELVNIQCENVKIDNPYILKEVYLREKDDILRTCKNTIIMTEKDSQWQVLVNELSFGDRERKYNKIFGDLPKQKINIGGIDLYISGSIDRVDINRNDPSSFRIVDYKTGSKWNFDKKLRITKGRGKNKTYDYSQTQKLQYYIYKKALEKILETRSDIYPNPKINNFIYIFGEEEDPIIDIEFNEEFVQDIENRIIGLLNIDILESEKDIVFDETNGLSCKYCDYKAICIVDKNLGDVEMEVEY